MQNSKQTAVEAVASFLKERDENVLPGEADDEERKASAQCIVRVVAKFSSPTNLENAERAERGTFSPPFSYVPIPLDADGQGPADDVDAVSVVHDVWDANCVTVATCGNEEAARSVAALMNAGVEARIRAERAEMEEAARFLLDRLDDYEARIDDIDDEREFIGHVAPAAARLRSCLIDKPEAVEAEPVANAMSFFSENVDQWGAAEWFDRLAKSIREQDKAVVAGDEIALETYRMIAASSAMHLVREHEARIRSCLLADKATAAEVKGWRVFENIFPGEFGIEDLADPDGDAILPPRRIDREHLDRIVSAYNTALTQEPTHE